MDGSQPAHYTIEIRRGHAADEVTIDHHCRRPGASDVLATSEPIAISGSDAAVVNLGGEFVVTVTCPTCGLAQVVHLRGSGASDLGR